MERSELEVGQIVKTNTSIPEGPDLIPVGILLRVKKFGGLCYLETLDGSREFGIPYGNLLPTTEEDIADGGPEMPPRAGGWRPI